MTWGLLSVDRRSRARAARALALAMLALCPVACVAASVFVPSIARAGSWGSAQRLSPSSSSGPQALFTAAGEALVLSGSAARDYAWGPAGPVPSGTAADALVRVAVKEPGAGFGASQVISGPGATYYTMFANPDGSVVAQWIDQNGLQRAVRPPFGNFGRPTTLVPASELAAAGPPQPSSVRVAVSVDKLGDVLLVWKTATPSGGGLADTVTAQYRPAGGAFGPAQTVFTASTSSTATFGLALDDRGDAFIAVTGVLAGSSSAATGAYMIERPQGGAFSQPTLLSDPRESVRTYLYPDSAEPGPFAVDGQGDVVFAWDASPLAAPGTVLIRAAVREHGQWLPTQTVWPTPPAQAQSFGMGTYVSAGWGPSGQLGVAWIDNATFDFSFRPAGGPFGAAQTMPGLPAFWPINLGFDSLGDTVALPIVTDPSLVNNDGMVTATVRSRSGAFQAATTLGPTANGTAALSFDAFGDGIASWSGLVDRTSVIFAAYYDAAPPVVTQFAVRSQSVRRAARTARPRPKQRFTTVVFKLSKPGVVRVSLAQVTCRQVVKHRRHRTVCSAKELSRVTHKARAGLSSRGLTPTMTRALAKRGEYRLTAQATDGPGRKSAVRTTTIKVR